MRWLAVAALALAGCLSSDVLHCDDGSICPSDLACDPEGGCVLPSQLAQCKDAVDGAACTIDVLDDGYCLDHVCRRAGCGDGIVDLPEVCDGPPAAPDDECTTHGFYGGGKVGCTASCQWDFSACIGQCGDHEINGAEACDDLDLGGQDCRSLGYYDPGAPTCNAACQFDTSDCTGFCGDGLYAPAHEVCDGDPPIGLGCDDFGFQIGRLACSQFCAPSFATCESDGWRALDAGLTGTVSGMWAEARDNLWVAAGNVVAHFDGSAWSALSTTAPMRAVWGSGEDDVWFAGDGAIGHWNGATWSETAIAGTFQAITGTAPDDVWATGVGVIAHWNGSAWSVEAAASQLDGVWAAAPGEVFAVGDNRTVLHYDGAQWTSIDPPAPIGATFRGVWGTSGSDVWVVGGAGASPLVEHWDGGAWRADASGASGGLRAVWGASAVDVWAAGAGGAMARWDGHGWRPIASTSGAELDALAGSGPDDVYAGGTSGALLHHQAIDVLPQVTPTTNQLLGVWASSPSDVFAVGEGDTALHFDGATWTAMSPSTAGTVYAVWGFASDDVWATADNGIVSHFDGLGWTPTSISGGTLYAVWGAASGDVWAGGAVGELHHWDGTQWSNVASNTSENLWALWGTGPSDVWAAADHGTIVHYDGTAWTPTATGFTGRYLSIGGSAPDDVYAVGDLGEIDHWNGSGWTPMASGTARELDAIVAASRDDVWVMGAGGVLLHREGTRFVPVASGTTGALQRGFVIEQHTFLVGAGGYAVDLLRGRGPESVCDDAWDDDGDGLANCADPDCASWCSDGGPCAGAVQITCGASVSDTTLTAAPHLDDYVCSPRVEPGRERAYRLTAPATGTITASLTTSGDHDLIVLGAAGPSCDPAGACLGASSTSGPESVGFAATAGADYYLIVDGQAGEVGTYTLTVSCP